MKPAIITFIGWHNSGKTTLAKNVIAELIRRGRRVAVVKSTKEDVASVDKPQSDTALYRQAGTAVLLAGEDFLFLQGLEQKPSLASLAARFFADMELVVGEGFKGERGIAKIEVFDGERPQLAAEVDGVVAVVGEGDACGWHSFFPEEYVGLADFIEKNLITNNEKGVWL